MATLVLALAIVPLVGCGGEPKQAPTATTETPPPGEGISLTADSARGNFQIRVRPEGGSIPLNQPFAVLVDLLDPASGEPLANHGEVTLDARMPAHGHGMLRDVELVRTSEGSLRAEGLLFHMIGHWEFHVDMTSGPRVERAQVSFDLAL